VAEVVRGALRRVLSVTWARLVPKPLGSLGQASKTGPPGTNASEVLVAVQFDLQVPRNHQ